MPCRPILKMATLRPKKVNSKCSVSLGQNVLTYVYTIPKTGQLYKTGIVDFASLNVRFFLNFFATHVKVG